MAEDDKRRTAAARPVASESGAIPDAHSPESIKDKSARLKALRLQADDAKVARVARATRKARARRDILG